MRINHDILDTLSAIGGLAYILFHICSLLCSVLRLLFGVFQPPPWLTILLNMAYQEAWIFHEPPSLIIGPCNF